MWGSLRLTPITVHLYDVYIDNAHTHTLHSYTVVTGMSLWVPIHRVGRYINNIFFGIP